MFNAGSALAYLKLDTRGWNTPMRNATIQLQSLGRTFVRFGIAATGSLTLVEREFGRFDKAMRHATSVSETTEEQFNNMSRMALDASVQWNKMASETAQAFYYLGSAGLSVTEQMQAFNDTVMLSRAMGSELSMTVEGLVDIVRAFGLEFADTREIADQLTKTVISSNQTFRILDKALTYASASARQANNTLAETNAMLGVMANAGIKGSMAGTVLRRALTNLMSPTAAMAGLMQELNLHIYDSAGRMKPFIEIIGEISDKLKNSTDAYKNMVFEVLFGRRAISGQIMLFNYGSKALRQYAAEIANAGGTTERVAKKQMQAFLEQIGRLWQEMRRTAIIIGEKLAPALERLSSRLRFNLGVLQDYIEANGAAVTVLMKWFAVIGAGALIIPPLLMLTLSLATQFSNLAVAIGKMGIALATNPFMWLTVGLYALRAMLSEDFWKQAWEKQIKPFLELLGTGFFETIAQIMWQFSLIPDAMKNSFEASWEFLNNWLDGVTRRVRDAFEPIGLLISGIFSLNPDEIKNALGLYAKRTLNIFKPGTYLNLMPGFFESAKETKEPLFFDKAERNASYQSYIKDLRIFGDQLAWTGKEIAMDFGKILKKQFEEDMAALSGISTGLIELLPAEARKALEELSGAWIELKNMLNAFTTKEDPFYSNMLNSLEEMNIKLRRQSSEWREAHDMAKTYGATISKVAQGWKSALEALFRPVEGAGETWGDLFTGMLGDVRSAWSTAINDMITNGGRLKDFMEQMFMGILNAANKVIADRLAYELLYSIFGGDGGINPGVARFKDIFSAGNSYFTPSSVRHDFGGGGGGLTPPTGRDIGQFSAQKPVINIHNQAGVEAAVQKTAIDGDSYVIDIVTRRLNSDPNFRDRFRR